MTTTSFAGSANHYIQGTRTATYSDSRNTASGVTTPTTTVSSIGQWYKASAPNSGYYLWRYFLAFDTSSIPDTDTITQVNLNLTCANDYSTADFDIKIVKCDWSATDPITSGNMDTAFDNALNSDLDSAIWRNTNGMATNTEYSSDNLSTSWINTTGKTYYALISGEDYANSAPTGLEYISIYSIGATTEAYRPELVVIHEAGVVTYQPRPPAAIDSVFMY
jgi:hypothetical protein